MYQLIFHEVMIEDGPDVCGSSCTIMWPKQSGRETDCWVRNDKCNTVLFKAIPFVLV